MPENADQLFRQMIHRQDNSGHMRSISQFLRKFNHFFNKQCQQIYCIITLFCNGNHFRCSGTAKKGIHTNHLTGFCHPSGIFPIIPHADIFASGKQRGNPVIFTAGNRADRLRFFHIRLHITYHGIRVVQFDAKITGIGFHLFSHPAYKSLNTFFVTSSYPAYCFIV